MRLAACLFCAMLHPWAVCGDNRIPVSDEEVRLTALRTVFHGMQFRADPLKRLNDSARDVRARDLFFPDAFSKEIIYKVTGKPLNKAESCAASDVITGKTSNTRQVRAKVFRWPNENDGGLLVALQYTFPGASPPMSCPSIGLLVHLVRNSADWEVRNKYLLETVHHHSVQMVQLLDLTGDGRDSLVVASQDGGAGEALSSLQVFDLSRGAFDELLHTNSLFDDGREVFKQALDIDRTRSSHGEQFCVSKTSLVHIGIALKPPRLTKPCYRRGQGVDPKDGTDDWLAPLR
jgi:hypothetical protein